MKAKQIHLIAFDNPYPPDYGGIIDIFYKIKSLSEAGIKIHLHCFVYGRGARDETKNYCESAHYYKRKRNFSAFFSKKPYIVKTRKDKNLLNNLIQDEFPILFEGLHTCYYLNHKLLKNRLKIVRTHNIEHQYYHALYESTTNLFKKIYYFLEALKLKKFEKILFFANHILSISATDQSYFQNKYHNSNLVPSFHGIQQIKKNIETKDYILFHGNLLVEENHEAVNFLLNTVFNKMNFPVLITGKNPKKKLKKRINLSENIHLIENPDNEEMKKLIQEARIIILFTHSQNGLKLKLLYSLNSKAICIANNLILKGSGISTYFHVADTADKIYESIQYYYQKTLSEKELIKRNQLFKSFYSDKLNAQKILKLIFYDS